MEALEGHGRELRCDRVVLEALVAAVAARVPVAVGGRGENVGGRVEESRREAVVVASIEPVASVVPVKRGPHAHSEAVAAPVSRVVLSQAAPKQERLGQLEALRMEAAVCVRCAELAGSRSQVVFGAGAVDAEVLFLGHAPGEAEDREGVPFAGEPGALLEKILKAMELGPEQVYMTNLVRCSPDLIAGVRAPKPLEIENCHAFLVRQVEAVRPRAIVALGAQVLRALFGETQPMAQLRGRWYDFGGIPVMATFHPKYLVDRPSLSEKRKVWEDLLLVLERLGRPVSEKQRGFFLPKR